MWTLICLIECEETLRQNVYDRQRKANEVRNRLEEELLRAHLERRIRPCHAGASGRGAGLGKTWLYRRGTDA